MMARMVEGWDNMTQQIVIVTGASRGLGAAIARRVAQLGASVVLMARTADSLEQVMGQITAAGGDAISVPGDVSSIEDCRRVVAQTIERYGRLDALVNNAGVIRPIASLAEADPVEWQRLLEINLNGPAFMMHAAMPYLREARGRVINVSSGASVNPKTGWSAYAASKAGLNMLTRVVALEEPAVTTIAIRPGIVDTSMQSLIREDGAAGMSAADHARFMRVYSNGDLLSPDEPGSAIAALALHAPHSLSGDYLAWSDEVVQAVINRCCR